jgi:DNA-binding XRE family transcriptional regulator
MLGVLAYAHSMGSSMREMPQQAEFYRRLGKNLRDARERAKLSQDRVAQLVGLKRTSLTNIESGRQHPPLHVLCDIVSHLNVTVSDVLPVAQVLEQGVALGKMLGKQLQDPSELAFVKKAIGLKATGAKHGDTQAKD